MQKKGMFNYENYEKPFPKKKFEQRGTTFGPKLNENKAKSNQVKEEYTGQNYRNSQKKAPKKTHAVRQPQSRWTEIPLKEEDLARALYVPKAKVKNSKHKIKEMKEISTCDTAIPKRSSASSSNNSTKSSSNKEFTSSPDHHDKDQMSTTMNSNEDNRCIPLNESNRSSNVSVPTVSSFYPKSIFPNSNPISGPLVNLQHHSAFQGRNIHCEKSYRKFSSTGDEHIYHSRNPCQSAFNKFSSAGVNISQTENTEILRVKVKLGEEKPIKAFKLRKYDDLFMTVSKFCVSNGISEKFITPFMSQAVQALNSIYKIFNVTIKEEDIYYLKRLMCIWKTGRMPVDILGEGELDHEMCYTSIESDEEKLTGCTMLNNSV